MATNINKRSSEELDPNSKRVRTNSSKSSHSLNKDTNKEINEKTISQQSTDYEEQFDSELDKLLFNYSFPDKVTKEFEAVKEELQIQDDKVSVSNLEDDDDELFDSDGIINESESEELNEDLNKKDGIKNTYEESGSEVDPNDSLDLMTSAEDFSDFDLDSTLILRKDDPTQPQLIVEKIEFDIKDVGFKTASGNPIKIKMSEEEQKSRAKKLGLLNCEFKS